LSSRTSYAETAKLPSAVVTHKDNVGYSERYHMKARSQAADKVSRFVDDDLQEYGKDQNNKRPHPVSHKYEHALLAHISLYELT
jgi:hypothetical protein